MAENNSIKNEIIKLNKKTLDYVQSISKEIKASSVDEIKELESVDLSNEFWNLLKLSKSKVADTKDGIDTLLSINNKWNNILILKNEGQILNDDQNDFMIDYIGDEYKDYFTTNTGLKNVNFKWEQINKTLKNKFKKKRKENVRKQIAIDSNTIATNNCTDNNKITILGIALIVIGIVCICLAATIITKTVGKYAAYIVGGIVLVIGVVLIIYQLWRAYSYTVIKSDSYTTTRQSAADAGDNYQSLSNVPLLSEISPSPPPDSKILDTFFIHLEKQIKNENQDDTVNQFFQSLQKDIIQIINSLKLLQDQCDQLIQQIDSVQNFNTY
eukprot:405204_1